MDDRGCCISIGGRLITTFRFADDIIMKAEEEKADVLVDHADMTTRRYKLGLIPTYCKVTTNNPKGFQREIRIKSQRLEAVENFQVPGIISNEGTKPDIICRIVQTTTALSRLKVICRDTNIITASKVKLTRTLI